MQGFALCTKSKVWALVITSVLFGLLHCVNNEVLANGFFTTIPIYIEIGMLMGFFAILSDGIEISCGMHFINNFLAFTVFSSEGGTLSGNALVTFKRGAVSVSDYLIPIAVAALIYLCLHKKMGWDIKKAFDNSGLRKDVPPPYFA
jgi:fucose 4-O-acetylase-like acetyltransferase